MINKRQWLLFLVLILVSPITNAQDSEPAQWQRVMQQLASHDISQGHFKQSKHLKILKKPIVSSGNFALLRDHGLIWNTVDPLSATIVIVNRRIYQLPNHEKRLLIEENQQGTASTLLSILSGNLTTLEQSFEIEPHNKNGGWSLKLKPKDEALAKVFSLLILEGAQQLNAAKLLEPQGTQTIIEFSQITNTPLSSDQLMLLSEQPSSPNKQTDEL